MNGHASAPEPAKPAPLKTPEVPYRRYLWLLILVWSGVVGGSLAWNLVQNAQDTQARAVETARALLEKDLLYREWSILFGGVYVPKTSPPGELAPSQEQETAAVTRGGEELVLLNPALISRQIFRLQDQQMGIKGHLTSLTPIHPANGPDPWERQGLVSFEAGAKEASVTETRHSQRYFRLMQPLVTYPACLRCHEEQGRKPGTIRGGISLTVPMKPFETAGENHRLILAHACLWLAGIGGLILGAEKVREHDQSRRSAEAQREQLIGEMREALANVRTLRGLIPICASCKRIRNDQGYWTRLETYLKEHSDAEFSHGLCLDCVRKLYPELSSEVEARVNRADGQPGRPEPDPPPQA